MEEASPVFVIIDNVRPLSIVINKKDLQMPPNRQT